MLPAPPTTVSLCMIVRNEAANLRPCLEPVRGLFAEMVVVDTGSTDGTKAIVQDLGAQAFDFPWGDDFSTARNAALDRATGEWIFWLDADDRVDEANARRLRELFAVLAREDRAYIMNCLNVPRHVSDGPTVISHARLFRRHPDIRWRGRVHEQILPAIQALGHELAWTDVSIWHSGYHDPAIQQRKANRDLRLLRLEYAVNPEDPFVLYNLGLAHTGLGQYQTAWPLLQRSLDLVTRQSDWVRKLFVALFEVLVRLNRPDEALRIGRLGLQNFPNDPELSIRHADLLGKSGDLRGAEAYLASLLNSPPQNYLMVGVPADAVRKECRRLLGVVLVDQHRYAEAEQLLRELLAEYPDYVQAQVNLGELLLTLRRFDSVAAVIQQLAQGPEGEVYAWGLQAELDMMHGQWDHARSLLGRAIAGAPQMLWPRMVLSDCLLQLGDKQGFLAVQRDILRLDPGNLFAIENLRRLDNATSTQLTPDRQLNWTITT